MLNPMISKSLFGYTADGSVIEKYNLSSKTGLQIEIITYGGIITSIITPDRNGNLSDIVLGYDTLNPYLESNDNYFGALIGRYCNRIADARFSIDNKTYELTLNDGQNHLHGGQNGFDKVIWQANKIQTDTHVGVKLNYSSLNGEEGYPGNLDVIVSYLLHDDDSFEIVYEAETDERTIINLTSHSYFNLSDTDSILDHQLWINSDDFLPVDARGIPTGEIAPVKDSPFNFKKPKLIGDDFDFNHDQLKICNGYDHNFILNKSKYENPLTVVYEPKSGRVLEIFTTEPGIQLYTGNFIQPHNGKNNRNYRPQSGLCLETQHFPNSPNNPEFPSVILEPGEQYCSKTKYKFSTQ